MSRQRFKRISPRAKDMFYKIPYYIKKISFLYPDGHSEYEMKECVWGKGKPNEHKGFAACTAQLVCPYVGNWRYNSDGTKIVEALGKCRAECRDPEVKEAIEAWVTLHPDIY